MEIFRLKKQFSHLSMLHCHSGSRIVIDVDIANVNQLHCFIFNQFQVARF